MNDEQRRKDAKRISRKGIETVLEFIRCQDDADGWRARFLEVNENDPHMWLQIFLMEHHSDKVDVVMAVIDNPYGRQAARMVKRLLVFFVSLGELTLRQRGQLEQYIHATSTKEEHRHFLRYYAADLKSLVRIPTD